MRTLCLLAGVLAVLSATASYGETAPAPAAGGTVRGVNPKDNITKVELLYKYDAYTHGVSVNSLTLKYDRALSAAWGFNIEAPLPSYRGFGVADAGLGDIQARLRYVKTFGPLSLIAGAELVAPTATAATLGRGKWQANPVVAAVYAVTPQVFTFFGLKQFWSFAGDSHRVTINETQPRLLTACTSKAGWWALADVKYTKSWECSPRSLVTADGDLEPPSQPVGAGCMRPQALDVEFELGQMLGPRTGVFARVGTSFLDSTRDFGVNLGFRHIF